MTRQLRTAGVVSRLLRSVDGADPQLVHADAQVGELERRDAGGEGGAVERALEGRADLVRAEKRAWREVLAVSAGGPESIVVFGAVVSGGASTVHG